MNQFNHITNRDHSCCTHDVDYTPRNGFITDEAARGLLWVEFENIINIGERYVNNYGTNTVEAFNHEITKFCPKSINFHTTYVLRGNLAALARLSPNYKLEIMNALQVTVDNNTAERLLSEVDRKQYLSEWRRSTQYKQRKALARKRNREANKNRPTMENQNGDQHLENEVIQNYSYKNGGQLKRRERRRRRNGKQMEGQKEGSTTTSSHSSSISSSSKWKKQKVATITIQTPAITSATSASASATADVSIKDASSRINGSNNNNNNNNRKTRNKSNKNKNKQSTNRRGMSQSNSS